MNLDLLPYLLQIISTGSDGQLHGALKVLNDLVDDSLSETNFFAVARDLVKILYDVAANEKRKQVKFSSSQCDICPLIN